MRKGLTAILMFAALLIWPLGEAFQLVSACCWVLSVVVWTRMDHGTGRASWRLGSHLPWASDVERTETALRPRKDIDTGSTGPA